MPRLRSLLILSSLALAATGVGLEHHVTQRLRAENAALAAGQARLAATVEDRRQQLTALQRELAGLERELDTRRSTLATAEAGSAMKLWGHRITLLKQLLAEFPDQSLPELRLLTPTDWVQVVRSRELDSSDNIRGALTALRALARKAMGAKLQEALLAYTKASGGELPATLRDLLPSLTPPADGEMLQRYTLVRTGRLSPDDHEILIRESDTAEFILSVGLATWDISLNAKHASTEADKVDLARAFAALSSTFDGFGDADQDLAQMLPIQALAALTERAAARMEAALGDAEIFADSLKRAVKQYIADHSGESPTELSQVLPYMENLDKLMPIARPFFAELRYMQEHRGKAPESPAELQPYLDAPFNAAEALRIFKLTVNGEGVTIGFKITTP
jgi:hypothetical protein